MSYDDIVEIPKDYYDTLYRYIFCSCARCVSSDVVVEGQVETTKSYASGHSLQAQQHQFMCNNLNNHLIPLYLPRTVSKL